MTTRADGEPGSFGVDEVLARGELTVIGRIRSASNATFLCEAHLGDGQVHCVYKPVRGEAPLWDFPDGTLAGRHECTHLRPNFMPRAEYFGLGTRLLEAMGCRAT